MSIRLLELAVRLVASGPKASNVSASECNEISEGLCEVIAECDALRMEVERYKRTLAQPHHVYAAEDAAKGMLFHEVERLTTERDTARKELAELVDAVIAGPFEGLTAVQKIKALNAEIERISKELEIERQAAYTLLRYPGTSIAALTAVSDRLSAEHERWRPVVDAVKFWRRWTGEQNDAALRNVIDAMLAAERNAK